MADNNNRDEMVIATKYTSGYMAGEPNRIQANFSGTGTKSMKMSLEASLKKLQTSYVDILYLHWWDSSTKIEEVMHSLNDLVVAGKVLYLGISDTPAWIVSKANRIGMPRREWSTASCWYWLIRAGSVSLKTAPIGRRASSGCSFICPSERSVSWSSI